MDNWTWYDIQTITMHFLRCQTIVPTLYIASYLHKVVFLHEEVVVPGKRNQSLNIKRGRGSNTGPFVHQRKDKIC